MFRGSDLRSFGKNASDKVEDDILPQEPVRIKKHLNLQDSSQFSGAIRKDNIETLGCNKKNVLQLDLYFIKKQNIIES